MNKNAPVLRYIKEVLIQIYLFLSVYLISIKWRVSGIRQDYQAIDLDIENLFHGQDLNESGIFTDDEIRSIIMKSSSCETQCN